MKPLVKLSSVEYHVREWGPLVWRESVPRGAGRAPESAWRPLDSLDSLPRGVTCVVRDAAGRRRALAVCLATPRVPPATTDSPAEDVVQSVRAYVPPQDAQRDLEEASIAVAAQTARLGIMGRAVADGLDQRAKALDERDSAAAEVATRDERIGALSAEIALLSRERALVEGGHQYVHLLLGGLAHKLGLLPTDQWETARRYIPVVSAMLAYDCSPEDTVALIRARAELRREPPSGT